MDPRRIASIAAVVGGASWLLEVVLTWSDGSSGPAGMLFYVGLVALAVALGAGGYTLVETAPLWLRAVVVVATPALVLMVWQMVDAALEAMFSDEGSRGAEASVLIAAVFALVLGGWGFTRHRDPETAATIARARQRPGGRRAAR